MFRFAAFPTYLEASTEILTGTHQPSLNRYLAIDVSELTAERLAVVEELTLPLENLMIKRLQKYKSLDALIKNLLIGRLPGICALRRPQHPIVSRRRRYCSCYPRCRTAVTIVVGLGICHAIAQVVRGAGAVVADTVVLVVEVEVEAAVAVVATPVTTVVDLVILRVIALRREAVVMVAVVVAVEAEAEEVIEADVTIVGSRGIWRVVAPITEATVDRVAFSVTGVSSMVTSLAIVRKAETLVLSAINVKRMATLQLAAMLKRERMLN
ncbi:hypothetical protein CSKR_201249 [Clonorchis sinensis]|uniref:Uncharacterized protein n=1 Tax=Clonorchis sinensis TaxID=79923 RepID=A0A8T1MNQ9_CLOSI|nr:hypothetical protein CSKR_201249 [Clonorchis sinensis]